MDLKKLMVRSDELEMIIETVSTFELDDEPIRYTACRTVCKVSIEHAQSLRILAKQNNFTSSIALMRLQYEALVRGVWILYAASDIAISKITNELTFENEKKANKLPMLSDMIKQIDGKAPTEAVEMINEFKKVSWCSLGSYVHAGIHVVHGYDKGYSLSYIIQVIEMSNSVSTMTGMLLANICGCPDVCKTMSDLPIEFEDCLPKLIKTS